MKKTHVAAAFAGALLATVFTAGSASAQSMNWPLGSELRGSTIQVDFPTGDVNTLMLYPDGTASIQGRNGVTVPAQWTVQNQQLCLAAGGESECWPYATAFQQGQTVNLTSDCASSSRWTAVSLQQPPAPPVEQRSGERG
ncbi:MAG TPA: hypothetical protein VGX37_02465 [Allosphingosinicella sp.]|nr:hypothetical protein [Allosphingosinicella sp.]